MSFHRKVFGLLHNQLQCVRERYFSKKKVFFIEFNSTFNVTNSICDFFQFINIHRNEEINYRKTKKNIAIRKKIILVFQYFTAY